MPSLLALEGPLTGQSVAVGASLVVGRGEADLVVDDAEISRRHAVVRARDGELEVEDLGSLNGTWVNGARIEAPTRLRPGDTIRLGQTTFEVETAPAPAPAPSAAPPPARAPGPPPLPVRGPLSRVAAPAALSFVGLAPLAEARCPECGAAAAADARFCSACGAPLAGGQDGPPRPDELRLVTALFADVVGSTALGERLAPDEVKALIGECVNRVARVVEQFGGTVSSYMGDGIAAFFGMPTAHEDDPERAAHAALAILEMVGDYAVNIRAAWGVEDFDVRVGINTGQAAVGVVGGAEQQQVALGDTANVAARLQSHAAPGAVVAGEATARLLAHRFAFESLGELTVKGRTQPVTAWRLVRFQPDARPSAPTPLVGRDAEAGRLRGALEELKDGRGRVLMLVGDAGIGKSRLLGELETLVVAKPVTLLEGQCRSYGGELLYWPFAEVLRRWLGVEAGDAEVSVRTKLRARLGSFTGLEPDALLRGLGRLLSVRLEETAGEPAGVSEHAAEIRRAFRAWLEALCVEQPVVLALDDFQWADAPTRELAESLLEVTDRAPLLLAIALRAEPGSEGARFRLHALEHYAHRVLELALEPLPDAASEELLGMLVPDALEEDARRELIVRAEGNPLYLEELLRTLIEGGELERRQRTWALTSVPAAIPPAVEGLLTARIDRLSEEARRLLQVAAVIGRTFPARALEHAAGSDAFGEALATLLRAQLAHELTRYPELVYTFKHGLLQEAVLATLTPGRRRDLYGQVAAAFEKLYPAQDDRLELLAHYWSRSHDLAKACDYLELAGSRAASLDAAAHAAELWKRARKLAGQLGDEEAVARIEGRLAAFGSTV